MIIFKFVRKISKKQILAWGIAGTIFLILCLIGFSALGLYILNWQDNFLVKGVSRLVPFPILKVNNNYVRFSDYQKDVDTLIKFYNQESAVGGLPVPDKETIKENIIERLKRNVIIEEMAKREGIEITQEELNQEFYKMMVRVGSPEQIEEVLEDLYGWDENEFKKRIVKNVLLQERLREKLGLNVDLDTKISEELDKAEIKEYIK